MDYGLYRTNFYTGRAAVTYPTDCTNAEPIFYVVTRFSWSLRWILTLSGNHYIRIWEHFDKIHRVNSSTRRGFSYHYGPMEDPSNATGNYRVGAPVVLRIDAPNNAPAHMHYLGPTPHYEQANVRGMDLITLEMLSWLKGVFIHRQTGMPLHEILQFEV